MPNLPPTLIVVPAPSRWSTPPEFSGEVEPAVTAATRSPRCVLRTEGEGQSLAALLAQSQPQFEATPATVEDDYFWLYSSDSTGAPKGAVHRHRDMAITSQRFGVKTLGICEDDVFYSEAKLLFLRMASATTR